MPEAAGAEESFPANAEVPAEVPQERKQQHKTTPVKREKKAFRMAAFSVCRKRGKPFIPKAGPPG
jgi:hypothetical protein